MKIDVKQSGIYKIKNKQNNKVYIGSSNNVLKRWTDHISNLITNTHHSYKLQADFNKYGLTAFTFEVIEVVYDKNNLKKTEQYWINYYNSCDDTVGYNVNPFTSMEDFNYTIDSSLDIYYVDKIDFNIKNKLKENINILEDKINNIGNDKNSLSKGWFIKKDVENLDKLSNHLINYFKHKAKVHCSEQYWTTFRSYQNKLSIKGAKKSFLPLNVNIIEDKRQGLAFIANLFLNSFYLNKLTENKQVVNDKYALSMLLKWILSVSDIDKPINIYIPSSRMRNLLIEWLN